MRGRKPKPPGLSTRQLRQYDGGPPARLPACPPHVQGEARKEWFRLGRKLLEFGLVTEIDKTALAVYCQAWGRWLEAEEQLTRFGTVIKSPNGYPIQSPYLPIANKAMEQMTKILVEFGMSPSSRSRVSQAPQQTPARLQHDDLPREERDPREILRALS